MRLRRNVSAGKIVTGVKWVCKKFSSDKLPSRQGHFPQNNQIVGGKWNR